MKSKKAFAIILAVVALVLTVAGVVWAATDSNPGASEDALTLHGHTPTSAALSFTLSTGQSEQITGTMNFDFTKNEASGMMSVPAGLSTTTVGLVLAKNQVYVGIPTIASIVKTPWVSIPKTTPDLYPLSLEMAAITLDVNLLQEAGFHKKATTKNGSLTTYTYTRSKAGIVAPPTLPIKLPHRATLTIAVTVASQGQLAGGTITLSSPSAHLSLSLTVLSYDQPVKIHVPSPSEVSPLTPALRNQVLGGSGAGGTIGKILTPQGLGSLSQIRLN